MFGLLLKKFLGSTVVIAIVHAILFWVAFFQDGGFHNSMKGAWAGLSHMGQQAWDGSSSLLQILGWPLLGCAPSNHFGFVLVMVLNSVLWGVVLGAVVAFILKLIKK